ncbi:MAG: TPM domain-containing protein [Paludibacteraceae bacterium]|nr:TPM domain-containing protein [Paludibacteraceae bacterium]
MKKWLVFILVMMGALSLSAGVYNPNTIPIPENGEYPSYISNPDGILSDSICAVINRKLYRLEDSTGVKTLIMVIEHIEGDDPHQFSLQVGNQYGIGSKEDNRGLILTLATLDRSYCLMPGHGLEGDLPDIICYRIDNHVLVPRLKESAWDKAVDETVDAVSALLLKDTLTVERLLPSSPSRNNQVEDPTFFEVVLGAIIGIPLILIMIWVLCRMLFFIPNLICNMIIPYKEVEWNPGRFMRMFMHCFNWFWNIRISLYYTDKLGRKILYVDNSDTEFISYSGGSGSSSYSSGYSSYSSSSHSHYHSSGRSHGSRGGGSFGGGGHSGRF